MNFKSWKDWIASLPWKFRWFVILVLFRPVIDLAWEEKLFVSLSLLQIVGVLTPFVIAVLFLSGALRGMVRTSSPAARYFVFWAYLLSLNAFLVVIIYPSIIKIAVAIKFVTPVYLYFFFRHFIKSREELEKMLQTILYSLIVPLSLLLYEVTFKPFRVVVTRSLERIMAGYADVVSLGVFIVLAELLILFFLMRAREGNVKHKNKVLYLSVILIIGVGIIGLIKINHLASFMTFSVILLLFFVYNIRKSSKGFLGAFLIFVIIVGVIITVQPQKQLFSLTETEKMVLQGDLGTERAFHGRMRIWIRHWGIFRNEASLPEQMIGTIGARYPELMTQATHNDYFRIIFNTGYLGFIAYLLTLLSSFLESGNLSRSLSFLVKGMLSIVLLLSISTSPLLYIHISVFFTLILSYIVLPGSLRTENYAKA